MFKGISRNVGSLVVEHLMAQAHSLTTDASNATDANKSLAAAIIVAGLIRGSKYWTLTMVSNGLVFQIRIQFVSLAERILGKINPISKSHHCSS